MKAILLLLVLMSSCISYQKCVDRYGQQGKDSVKILVPFTLKVPGETAIYQLPVTAPLPDTIIIKGNARLVIKHDSIDRYIQAICDTITIRDTIQVMQPPIVHFSDTKKFWQYWQFWAVVAVGTLFLVGWIRK